MNEYTVQARWETVVSIRVEAESPLAAYERVVKAGSIFSLAWEVGQIPRQTEGEESFAVFRDGKSCLPAAQADQLADKPTGSLNDVNPLKKAQKLADEIGEICKKIRTIDFSEAAVDGMTWNAIYDIEICLCEVNFIIEEEEEDDDS